MSYIGRQPQIGNFQICDAISTVNNQAAYTMQVGSVNVLPETANHMIVSLNGVIQAPISSFTVSGSTITFAANLVTGDVINFIQILGDVLDLGVPSDGTVTSAKLATNIDVSGTLGVGETSPLGKLHVKSADSGASVSANADELIIEGSGNTGITIASGNDSGGNIFFADDGGVQQGKIQYDHDANAMLFRANNVDRVKIHSNGVAAFNNGIALGVGTANTASNVLDDYEEGTFTPVISFGGGTTGIQYDTQLGFYTKIGRKVMIQINVALTNKGSSTGNAVVAGFPFTSASTSVGVGAVSGYKVANTGHMSMRLNDNNTTGTFQQLNSSGVLATLQNSAFSNDSEFQVSGTFFTA